MYGCTEKEGDREMDNEKGTTQYEQDLSQTDKDRPGKRKSVNQIVHCRQKYMVSNMRIQLLEKNCCDN